MKPKRLKTRILRLQARASRIHGISKQDFLKLTPVEFSALESDYRDEWILREEAEDRRTARIIVSLYRTSPKFKRCNKSEDDFMPKRKSAKAAMQSGENLWAKTVMIQNRMKAVQKHNEKVKNGR